MLDAVFDPKSFEEDDEVSEVVDEVVIPFISLDVAQEDYVVREIQRAVGSGQHNDCC